MTMASLNKNALGSDDEDDLESLRLAALKSLKPKTTNEIQSKPHPPDNSHCKPHHSYNKPSTFGAAQTTRHHNRGFRNNPGRIGRNGINSRARTNTNLISIQTIDPDEPKEIVKDTPIDIPKLILPQDRYHKPLALEDTPKESSGNKFDRYDDNSEESDSDSDELVTKPSRRERKDSVELLMDELENEINLLDGREEPEPKEESKLILYSNKLNDKLSSEDKNDSDEVPVLNDTLIILETDSDLVQTDEISSPVKDAGPAILESSPPYKKSRSRSPYFSHEKSHSQKRKSRTKSRSRSPLSSYRSPKRSRSPPRKVRYSPNHYPRALSPLTLNTEVLNTITMAPLSPRSAAFVLQNRQILARRQMSPRRSLSRESSCRRSLTPKRNKLSPRRRSRSPKRSLSPRKRSLSPRQSPRRRSNSPRNNHHRRSPNYKSVRRSSNSPVVNSKQSIHKRLGSRPNSRNVSPYVDKNAEIPSVKRKRASRSISLSLSPSPDRNYHKRPLNETTGHVNNRREKQRKDSPNQRQQEQKTKEDPVLEARRRKFESPVQINNGIIKLKSKTDEDEKTVETEREQPEESPEDKDFFETSEPFEDDEEVEENDEILDLNPNLDDLWSDDDESDDENEGRFKSKPTSEKKNITILPFRKLTARPTPKDPLLPKSDSDHQDRKYKRQRRRRSRSPLKSTNKNESKQKDHLSERDRVSLESKSKTTADKVRTKATEDEKKKEKNTVTIKSETNKNADVLKTLQSDKNVKRKVKIQKMPEVATGDSNVENSEEPEIIVENEDDIATNKEDDGGDLRAELSRRRAQRLIKAGSLSEALPTRLLKTALQEVVPKRSAVKQSKVTKVASKEGKLPIHMRLGSNPDVEEPPARERRSNKPRRTNRRKKQVQV